MCQKWFLLVLICTFLLTGCSQTSGTLETPAIIPSATITPPPSAPADSIQTSMLRLVPPGFLGAGYFDIGLIMGDPDLKSALVSVFTYPFQDSQILGERVDRMIGFSIFPSDPSQGTIRFVYILNGDFVGITLQELIQENELEDTVVQDYQGFELVEVQAESVIFALAIMDESTILFGEDTGVEAVLDTSLGLDTSPLSDLGAVLPPLFMASVFNNCPQYEALGCTAMVVPGLAQGTSSDISLLHVYEFEDPDQAASALDRIISDVESGNTTQTGSIKIVGDDVNQDGRYIILEDHLPAGKITDLFE
jgi:hypothetical protein